MHNRSSRLFCFRFLIRKKGANGIRVGETTMHSRASHEQRQKNAKNKFTSFFYAHSLLFRLILIVFLLSVPCVWVYVCVCMSSLVLGMTKPTHTTLNQASSGVVFLSFYILCVIFYSIPLNSNLEGHFGCIFALYFSVLPLLTWFSELILFSFRFDFVSSLLFFFLFGGWIPFSNYDCHTI